jgi:hypothetical protein
MALSGNTAIFAGSVFNGFAGGKYDGSYLWIKSTGDGKSRQERMQLDAEPAYDALAISGERVYLVLRSGEIVCLGK